MTRSGAEDFVHDAASVALTAAESRALDHDAVTRLGMPSIVLMENAARAVAEQARALGERFVILCGPGNNGGDGLAAARHLGPRAAVWLLAEPDPRKTPDAATQLAILRAAGHPVSIGERPRAVPGERRVWIDALFGTGLTRPLEGEVVSWVQELQRAEGPRLAVDLPSGLDADTGEVLGLVAPADVTVTFGALKRGMLAAAARPFVGRIVVESLGLPWQVRPG
jgi:hydroxyethylthiazole kinase-like uncharacterized protein yjeF